MVMTNLGAVDKRVSPGMCERRANADFETVWITFPRKDSAGNLTLECNLKLSRWVLGCCYSYVCLLGSVEMEWNFPIGIMINNF